MVETTNGPGRLSKQRCRNLSPWNPQPGAVVYWMSRDQRVQDNWALIHAQQTALEFKAALMVVFTLAPQFLQATSRQYDFMIGGLREVERELAGLRIPFLLLPGDPATTLPAFLTTHPVSALFTDFSPLHIHREWKEAVRKAVRIPYHETDAHNLVPCWEASPKLEWGAYTLRPKIHRLLPRFLEDFPEVVFHPFSGEDQGVPVDFGRAAASLQIDRSVPQTQIPVPGEKAARRVLDLFLRERLESYESRRNDPLSGVQSGLSPYLHFGQISAQRVALETRARGGDTPSVRAFLEELIVRRELSDNFCYYNPRYDSTDGFPDWARKTLREHLSDRRDYLYRPDQFEQAETHDPLWNAAQGEMVGTGKMHGYLRMYWAKKILEWTSTPEEAMETAIRLNDRYSLDGRDPNGYTGIAWSIGGVHDRAWNERKIFGKIRFMNDQGCKRKFDVRGYVQAYLRRPVPDAERSR